MKLVLPTTSVTRRPADREDWGCAEASEVEDHALSDSYSDHFYRHKRLECNEVLELGSGEDKHACGAETALSAPESAESLGRDYWRALESTPDWLTTLGSPSALEALLQPPPIDASTRKRSRCPRFASLRWASPQAGLPCRTPPPSMRGSPGRVRSLKPARVASRGEGAQEEGGGVASWRARLRTRILRLLYILGVVKSKPESGRWRRLCRRSEKARARISNLGRSPGRP